MKLAKLIKPNFLVTAVFFILYIVATCVLTFINKNIIQHCGTKPVKTGLKKLKVFNLHKSILVYFDREISSFARNRVRFLSETSTNSKHFGPMGTKLTLKQRPVSNNQEACSQDQINQLQIIYIFRSLLKNTLEFQLFYFCK